VFILAITTHYHFTKIMPAHTGLDLQSTLNTGFILIFIPL